MKSGITFIYSLLVVCLSVAPAHADTSSSAGVRWLCSTEKARWQALAPTDVAAPADAGSLKWDVKATFQTMDGFGGCFNELGWEALVALPAEKREAALKELFSPEGANFTVCRAPIGANDFSLGWYSLNETPGDYEMNHFIYPQCHWNSADMNVFLRDHLLPRLKRDGVEVEVWLSTITNDKLSDYVDPVLSDAQTAAGITGVGYQYGGQNAMLATQAKYPGKKLAQTERYSGWNAFDQGLITFGRIVENTSHFANSYFFWNMVLDESGLSRWNWRQNSLLTVAYNPEFYGMKRFSATVLPGARRIAVSGGPFKSVAASLNRDGSRVLLFANDTDRVVSATLDTGAAPVRLDVPAQSMNTVTLR